MSDDRDERREADDLTDVEHRALAALRHAPGPPGDLEERVVSSLRRRGLLRPPGRVVSWWRLVAAAAVLAATFLAGYGAGSWSGGPADDATDGYLLLLYETPEGLRAPRSEVARLVAEYSAWAAAQRREGTLVSGEKLAADGLVLARDDDLRLSREPGGGSARVLSGFFLIRADSYEEARQIAESCPHLAHGGEIEIRRIEETRTRSSSP